MQRNLLLGLVLLALGAGAVLFADSRFGAPWGYQGRRAVVLEVVGNAELYPSTSRKDERTQRLEEKTFLVAGDEVRISGASTVRLKLPEGELLLGAGSRVKIESAGVAVLKGRVEGTVTSTQVPLRVPALPGAVELDSADFVLVTDGRSMAAMQLQTGKARAALSASTWSAGTAPTTLLMKRPEGALWNKEMGDLDLRATCRRVDGGTVRVAGSAVIGAEVFVGARLVFPDEEGRFSVTVATPANGQVNVVGRKYTSETTALRVRCPSA